MHHMITRSKSSKKKEEYGNDRTLNSITNHSVSALSVEDYTTVPFGVLSSSSVTSLCYPVESLDPGYLYRQDIFTVDAETGRILFNTASFDTLTSEEDDSNDIEVIVDGVPQDPQIKEEEDDTYDIVYGHKSAGYLPVDVIKKHIFPFLGLRELFRFSQTNKELKNSVNMNMAVRSAMLHSRYSLESMRILKTLIDKRSIYPPTVDRVMRISLGKICEICLKHRVQHVRIPHGLFACWRCVKRYTERFSKKQDSLFDKNKEVGTMFLAELNRMYDHCFGERPVNRLTDPAGQRQLQLARSKGLSVRVTSQAPFPYVYLVGDLFTYLWIKNYFDHFNTRVGPIVTYEMVVTDGLEHLVQVGINSDHLICDHASHLKRLVCEPPEDDPLYHEFINAFETNFEYAKMAWYSKQVQREMRHNLHVHKKIKVAIDMIERLKYEMDQPCLNDLLHYHVNENFQKKIPRNRPLKMNVRWVEDLLKQALTCPSKVRGRKVKELVSLLLKKKGDEDNFQWWENQRLVVTHKRMDWGRQCMTATVYSYETNFTELRDRSSSWQRNDTLSRNPFDRRDGYISD